MISDELKNAVKTAALNSDDVTDFLEDLKQFLHEEVSEIAQPIDRVRWVSVDKVSANDYNPNSVAKTEMRLLYTSILSLSSLYMMKTTIGM